MLLCVAMGRWESGPGTCCSGSVFLHAVWSIQGLKGQGSRGLRVTVAMGQPPLPCVWACCLCHVWLCMWSVCVFVGEHECVQVSEEVAGGEQVPQEF